MQLTWRVRTCSRLLQLYKGRVLLSGSNKTMQRQVVDAA
jgi:hypothetical protein